MEILCPIILVVIGLGVSSSKFISESRSKVMDQKLFIYGNQWPLVNRIPLINTSNINSEFLNDYRTPKLNYTIFDWTDSVTNITQSLINYNKYLQASGLNYQHGNYLITGLNTIAHQYEFILISNLYSNESPPIFVQEMLTSIIKKATNQQNLVINVSLLILITLLAN